MSTTRNRLLTTVALIAAWLLLAVYASDGWGEFAYISIFGSGFLVMALAWVWGAWPGDGLR